MREHQRGPILRRIGALDIAAELSSKIGSYVHNEFIEFLAVEDDSVRCWYPHLPW